MEWQGGQYSPTTPTGDKGTTAPYGNIDMNFDLCELAKSCRCYLCKQRYNIQSNMLIKQVEEGIKNKGFSFL